MATPFFFSTMAQPTYPAPARAALVVASLFVAWHALAIVIAPAPPSYLRGLIYPYFDRYLTLLHLDNGWGFFAPDPATGRALRYRIENAAREVREFRLTEALDRNAPEFLRYTTLYFRIKADTPAPVVRSMAGFLCRLHAADRPRRVQLVTYAQQRLTPEDYLRGDRPLTPPYLREIALDPVECTPP